MSSLETLFIALLWIAAAGYAVWLLVFWAGLFLLKKGSNPHQPAVSVIIPARNEEMNLPSCLNALVQQAYPQDKYEIIVVDDDSTDKTLAIARSFAKNFSHIRVITAPPLRGLPGVAPKVNALNAGLEASRHDIIFLTDADCIASPNWLKSMMAYFEEDTGLVCGFSQADHAGQRSTFSARLQSLEMIAFLSACAGGVGTGLLLGATGQNMAFRRSPFAVLGGFSRLHHVFFGEDIFLVHLWGEESVSKIRFAIDPAGIITAAPKMKTIEAFDQHKRWLASMKFWRLPVKIFYALLLTLNFFVMLGIAAALFDFIWWPYILAALSAKILAEFAVVAKGTALTQRYDLLPYFPFYEMLQILFSPILTIACRWTVPTWKGRWF